MANQFKFTDWLGQEALRRLLNKLTVTEYFNTDNSKLFSDGVAKGASVRIPFPQRFIPTDGLGYQPQPLDMRETTVNCNRVKGVHFEVDSLEQALKMPRPQEYIRENIINPAMDALAQQIDSDAAQFAYQNTSNIVGVLGTNPSSFTTIGQVRERMIQMAAGTKKKAMPKPWMRVGIISVPMSACVLKRERIHNTSAKVMNEIVASTRGSARCTFLPTMGVMMIASRPTGARMKPAQVAV